MPAAGYELEPLRVEGISRSNPLKAARAVVRAAGAVGAARRILARHGADAVLGGGGYVAGPVGLAALHAADPGRADGGRLAPRADQPPARAARPPRLPRLPDRRARGRALPRHRPPGAADGRRPRGRPRGVRHPAGRDLRADLRRLAGRAVDQPRRRRGVRRRALPRAARPRRARLRRRCARPARTTTCASTSTRSGSALVAADLVVARAGGSVFELAQYGLPAVLVPYPHASADHQTANARWMAEAGAATILRDDELTPQRLRAEVDGLLADPDRLRAMATASRALARPTPRRSSRARCSRRPASAADPPTGSTNRQLWDAPVHTAALRSRWARRPPWNRRCPSMTG